MINHKYTFSSNRILISSLNQYLLHSKEHYFVVYNLIHIHFLTSISEKFSKPITLISPQNAASYIGIRWWLSLMRETGKIFPPNFNHILDCGDNAGLAMAAIRLNQPNILFDSNSRQLNTLKNRAHPFNINILTSPPHNFDLGLIKPNKKLEK